MHSQIKKKPCKFSIELDYLKKNDFLTEQIQSVIEFNESKFAFFGFFNRGKICTNK